MYNVDEKFKLLNILKNLKKDIKQAIPVVAKAWVPHKVHVQSFFNVLDNSLRMSKSLGVAKNEWADSRLSELAKLPRHRDNLPALSAMTSELLAIVEGDVESVESRVRDMEAEIERLKSEPPSKEE